MCQSCEVLNINGVPCHETGCPDAWRDATRECRECGSTFTPQASRQDCCDVSCCCAYNGLPSPDDCDPFAMDPDDIEPPTNC